MSLNNSDLETCLQINPTKNPDDMKIKEILWDETDDQAIIQKDERWIKCITKYKTEERV